MNSLEAFKLEFEDIPPQKPERVGKDSKMSKSNQPVADTKPAKKYSKTRGEHFKDIVIAILVTAIIAFGLGVKFQADRNAEVANAVKAVTATAQAEAPVKK